MSGKVRLGVIGVGGMGSHHAKYIQGGDVQRCELTAVCDIDDSRLANFPDVKGFTDSRDLIRSGLVDAVLIATPHYDHTTIGIDALQQGLHVLVEKPISVHKADCERLIAAHKANDKLAFQAMFQLRTEPLYRKVKKLIETGELGEITRVNWIATNWFRTEAYYASGGWRATWSGEGGGVLMNQCPHNLDMLQWLVGMPTKIRGFLKFGAKHDIEVEDQATAYLEYPNGATGLFITTTGEAPGTDRLEIDGEQGRLVIENRAIHFTRNEVPMTEFSRTTRSGFSSPDAWEIDIPHGGGAKGHSVVTQNFIDVILDGGDLMAPAVEGINSVELANCMLYSSLTGSTVDLPLDGAAFEAALKELIAKSKFVKKTAQVANTDIQASFK